MLSSKKNFGNRNKIESFTFIWNRQVLGGRGTLFFNGVFQ